MSSGMTMLNQSMEARQNYAMQIQATCGNLQEMLR